MYKSICAVLVAVAVFALVYGTRSAGATPSGLSTPQIVASGQVLNQTAGFSKTIFTPAVSGLYRLSVYAEITTPAPNPPQSCWFYAYQWTDSTGTQNIAEPIQAVDNMKGTFFEPIPGSGCAPSSLSSGFTQTFQAKKGTPIIHSMNGNPDGSAFSVYYTLERIQ